MSDDYDDYGWKEFVELMNDWSDVNEEKFFIAPDGYKFDALEIKRLLKMGLNPNQAQVGNLQVVSQYRDEITDALRRDICRGPEELYQYIENLQNIQHPVSNTFAYPLAETGDWIIEGDVEVIVYDSNCESIQEGIVVTLN